MPDGSSNRSSVERSSSSLLDRSAASGDRSASTIQLSNVSFGYQPDKLILSEVDLSVRKGEFLTLLGPSGCGKSTILNLIAGFIRPISGTLEHNGQLVDGASASRGVVFQGNALFDWMTVEQNIAFGFRFQRIAAAEKRERVRSMIELVGLAGSESKYPYQLSGGMRQRVAVARSMVIQPEILLMDEPFAAVDVQTREGLQEELLKLQERIGGTVLFVTHSIEEAVFLSDRVVVMGDRLGQIEREFDIHLPSPRHSKLNRVSDEFSLYRKQIYLTMTGD
ncbi:MAG: ABC transporter ATP-binding protein [Cyanobacteria bacterium P01_E01_bin.45]